MTNEEAINNLKDLWNEVYNEDSDGYNYAVSIDMAIEALSADAETKCIAQIEVDTEEVVRRIKEEYDITNNWIPVSERLPSKDGRYLVFYEGPIIGSWIEIMWYGEPLMPNVDVSGKHFYRSDDEWGDIIYDEVIVWMPLPAPYKESEVKE